MTNPPHKIDVKIGDKFDDLTIIGEPFQSGKNRRVPYRCKCGKEGDREVHSLFKNGQFKKSCGCARKKVREQATTHSKKIFSDDKQRFYLGRPICSDE